MKCHLPFYLFQLKNFNLYIEIALVEFSWIDKCCYFSFNHGVMNYFSGQLVSV